MGDNTTSRPVDPRTAFERIQAILAEHPDLAPRYEAAKRIIRVFRKPAFYELSQRCNLFCEGCYYFDGDGTQTKPETSLEAWDAFFAAEAKRGVSMAYLVGAEPALEPERLMVASRHFRYANIGANGTVLIDPAIPFRIMLSIWAGDDETDKKLRGGNAFRKAFRNYRGDPRVVILFTLSRWNLDTVRTVAEMCRDNGLPLTFNMYSPTTKFLEQLRSLAPHDDEYFRVSNPNDTPAFSNDDLHNVRRVVTGLMEDFPETVIYSRVYAEWTTRPAPLFELDENGVAPYCGSRILEPLRYYKTDLKQSPVKCCTTAVDCSECRIYAAGLSTRFRPSHTDLANVKGLLEWLEIIETLARIVIYDPQRAQQTEPAPIAAE